MNKNDQLSIGVAIIGTIAFYMWLESISATVAFASVLVLLYTGLGKGEHNK